MAHLASAAGSARAEAEIEVAEAPVAPGLKSAPIIIPEVVRKPREIKKVSKKPPKRGRKKKNDDTMSRDELLRYFTNLANDPNFNILPFPRFVQESNPELFAGETEGNFKERMKRIDYLDALDNAKTDEEREAIKAKRAKELENQVVPAYQKLPLSAPAGLKG